jgi:class 3 adenylate cyclase
MNWDQAWVSGLLFSKDELPRVLHGADRFSEGTDLVAGDRILRVGSEDVRGATRLGFVARALAQAGPNGTLPVVYERAGQQRETHFELRPLPRASYAALISISFAALAVLVYLRMGNSRMGRFGAPAFLTYSIWWLPFSGGPEVLTYADFLIRTSSAAIAMPLIMRTALVIPDDIPDPSPRALAWPWVFTVLVFLRMGFFRALAGELGIHIPSEPLEQAATVLGILYGLTLLSIIARNYRRADAIGRRQVKWLVFGVYAGSLPLMFCYFAIAVDPDPIWVTYRDSVFTEPALMLIPACVLIAIVRQQLFDIDRILSVAASYTLIGVLVIAGLLVLAPAAAQWVSDATGIAPTITRVMLSLSLAAVAVPTHARLRPQIDRIFFGERYALESGVNHLISNLSGCDSPQEMLTQAGQTLDDLVNPECCVIYARVGDDYAPVFLNGNAIPPAFGEDSGLIEELRLRHDPLAGETLMRSVRRVDLSPVERASLEALAAAVIIPLRSSKTLIAFLCLGPKRSGDIYTSTDLALLSAVAAKVSAELSRFTEVELMRHKMEMYETLRSYVPRAITEELESGRSIEPHRRDVSVMFVDIRGYTGYAEERKPEEIFSVLSRYTEIVSTIVGQHGGNLVEFSGDGIMAVFGAPQELPEKERAALNAARALSAAMAGFDLGPAPDKERLEVGIGIATGEALVGNIRSVDRLIWSAIGNTTNLAARLQALSREMDAGIVIDGATQRATPKDMSDFVHHPKVRIRGRREFSEIYTLARNIASRQL